MSVPATTIDAMAETELQHAAARVLQVWSHIDSAAEFVDDALMPRLRGAMAELGAAVRMSAA